MDTEAQAQDHEFGTAPWDIPNYASSHHQSPMSEFHSFAYGSSPIMPLEPAYSMSIPQPYAPQQLLPLTTPSQWPSMLTTQSSYPPVPLPPLPMPSSMPALHPIHTAPPISTAPTPRRTLTDADRRRMCLYHEENPHVKQTEIGAMFGVERSTVSKVLRQKEKYLFPDDGSRSPAKKSKGKFPDIERALSNWVRNHQRHGGTLDDKMIKEKALFFASTVGGPENHQKIMNSSWLEKFKKKNYLMGAQSRKGSVDTVNDLDSPGNGQSNPSVTQTPNGLSPSGTTTPSPLSPTQQHTGLKTERMTPGLPDFGSEYKRSHSQSVTSLETTPTLSAGVTSPGSLIFATDNPFSPSGQPHVTSIATHPSRPRSQTFPRIGLDPNTDSNGASDHVSPKNIFHQSPAEAIEEELGNSATNEPAVIKRNRSNPEIKTTSMQPPPLPKSNTVSPISTPGSPTQDEARRALELVMNYFQSQPSGLVAQDFMTIGKLMEKLELAQAQAAAAGCQRLHRIDEHTDSPRVSKKRSIHGL
ncbi:hypothetical protein AJ80_07776 [Polytolypa hystricis UAMH7299]|uniref:HTH CENPB-type domain-containing protein n=1 Tax=Polytolypa hystricis (strain UAMH7299) TaxID=1447883 RepID=A0A2B7XJL5_POLH7|nr:hypothetical protein AJ80_07776 [Polytolypa hystricis UAMH7299]